MRPNAMIESRGHQFADPGNGAAGSNLQIPREVGVLAGEISQTEEIAKHLIERLAPVMRQYPVANGQGADERETLSPLAGNLRELRERLGSTNETLRYILENLQV